jgi:hypothetical protein
LRTRTASISAGLENTSSLSGAKHYACNASSNIAITVGSNGHFTGWNYDITLPDRAYDFSEFEI